MALIHRWGLREERTIRAASVPPWGFPLANTRGSRFCLSSDQQMYALFTFVNMLGLHGSLLASTAGRKGNENRCGFRPVLTGEDAARFFHFPVRRQRALGLQVGRCSCGRIAPRREIARRVRPPRIGRRELEAHRQQSKRWPRPSPFQRSRLCVKS